MFTVRDGTTPLANVNIDQTLTPAGSAPGGVTDAGFTWQFLGGIYNIVGNTLVVRLTDMANGYVIADAMRVERLGDLPPAPAESLPQDGSSDSLFPEKSDEIDATLPETPTILALVDASALGAATETPQFSETDRPSEADELIAPPAEEDPEDGDWLAAEPLGLFGDEFDFDEVGYGGELIDEVVDLIAARPLNADRVDAALTEGVQL
jgi:hypothetical protein